MPRMFKTEFHNGNADLKPIVTMMVKVHSDRKYKKLGADGTKQLYECLYRFAQQLEAFMEEVQEDNAKSTF